MSEALKELTTHQDKWLYALKNLTQLENVPDGFRDDVFLRFFKAAEIAKLEPIERDAYEQSLKYYRDMKNVIDTAVEDETIALREAYEKELVKSRKREEALRKREEEERLQKEDALKRIAELEARLKNSDSNQ